MMIDDENDEVIEQFETDSPSEPHTKKMNSLKSVMSFCKCNEVTDESVDVGTPTGSFSFKRLLAYIGPGFLVAIAYIDPGNFGTDIQAGAMYQYQLIWMLILATSMGLAVQFLACKLGLITKRDLAQQCKESYPKPLTVTLWLMAEIAVIASDIPEVLGSAYALNILFGIPLPIGVIITAVDTLLFLMLQYASIRLLEMLIGGFLMIVSVCFVAELFGTGISSFTLLFEGFVPFLNVLMGEVGPGGYAGYGASAIGLLGAVVMPHNLFLHSALVKTRKLHRSTAGVKEAIWYNLVECAIALFVSGIINFSIICVAASAFYYSPSAGLNEASNLLAYLGSWAPIVFGVALLASGQSSTITGTYAGQFVMEGFLDLKIAMWKRNMITRSVAIVPSLVVAIIGGTNGSDALIVWSQIILSIQLPFALLPLLKMTSNTTIMGDKFKNSGMLQLIGWVIGIIVIVANVTLVGFSLLSYLNMDEWWGWVLMVALVIIGICYLVFLLCLSFVPVDKNSIPPTFPQDFDLESTLLAKPSTDDYASTENTPARVVMDDDDDADDSDLYARFKHGTNHNNKNTNDSFNKDDAVDESDLFVSNVGGIQ